jgi:hypothetical protein
VLRFVAAEFDTRWGSWSDNVKSWLSMRQGRKDFLFLRYEDMKKDPLAELGRISDFLRASGFRDFDAAPAALARAVELSSPERMRKLEKENAGQWVLTRDTRRDKPFVRTATSGGWKSTLPPESVAEIESVWGDVMCDLGYAKANTSVLAVD